MSGHHSLVRSYSTAIAVTLFVGMLLVGATITWSLVLPLARQSADDLGTLLVLSSETWIELPPGRRAEFVDHLQQSHGLYLDAQTPPLNSDLPFRPYRSLLLKALGKRIDGPLVLGGRAQDTARYWVEFQVHGQTVQIGFVKDRVGTRPSRVLLMVLLLVGLGGLVAGVVVARKLARPLQAMRGAALSLGAGEKPTRLVEEGPQELAELATVFNRLSTDISDLLEARTVLLAGISHDLRTPLTRLHLAVEMLPDQIASDLVEKIRADLGGMEDLIKRYLDLARGVTGVAEPAVGLQQVVEAAVDRASQAGNAIVLHDSPGDALCAHPTSLARILDNLLDNAQRYAPNAPIEIDKRVIGNKAVIRVMDRGPGLSPEEIEKVRQPFYRVEGFRSSAGGGSGLGLAIVKQLVLVNGWQLVLRPRAGGGLEAEVTLVLQG